MDWKIAIDIHREALRRVLAMLVAMAGFPALPTCAGATFSKGGANAGTTLPRRLHRAVLALLRPAEAAARRLIVIAARGLVVVLPSHKPPQEGSDAHNAGAMPTPSKTAARALPLFDPLPRWNRRVSRAAVPRICVPGFNAPFPVALPSPHDPIGAARLALRIMALGAVLDDLPRHALRLARLRQARMRPQADFAGPRRRTWPLRPGRPPGHLSQRCRRSAHAVHTVLGDLHGLALWALGDTS